jgi:site-specific recombinase XerD
MHPVSTRKKLVSYNEAEGNLVVSGKGNKERLVPVTGGAAEALADWLTVRGHNPGPLFVGVGNRNQGGELTTQAIYNMLRTRVKEAQITAVSPHDFRRTFVGELLDAGADIVTVQKLVGHADPATTARYDRRGERAKRRAVELLHVPYSQRTLAAEES